MALHIKGEDVPEKHREKIPERGTGTVITKRVYGNNVSLEHAVRLPGYHSTPHLHEGEQINYILEGEIWFFVEDEGFLCKKGDFSRIPAGAIHWAWNRSDENSIVLEAHAPSQIGGTAGEKAVGIYRSNEEPNVDPVSTNQRNEACHTWDWKAVEKKYNLT